MLDHRAETAYQRGVEMIYHNRWRDALPYLREADTLCMELLGGRPVGVLLPDVVELEVAGTGPGADDEIASGVFKDAVLETGATVRVPLFVVTGDRIRVDTRTARFVERVP